MKILQKKLSLQQIDFNHKPTNQPQDIFNVVYINSDLIRCFQIYKGHRYRAIRVNRVVHVHRHRIFFKSNQLNNNNHRNLNRLKLNKQRLRTALLCSTRRGLSRPRKIFNPTAVATIS